MVSTTIYERGHVIVVNVPFTDRRGSKPRPALVVSVGAFHRSLPDVIICPISSQARYLDRPGLGDHPLRHWRATGLRYPSTVRISNILAIEKRLIKRVLGALHTEDMARVAGRLARAFGLDRPMGVLP